MSNPKYAQKRLPFTRREIRAIDIELSSKALGWSDEETLITNRARTKYLTQRLQTPSNRDRELPPD